MRDIVKQAIFLVPGEPNPLGSKESRRTTPISQAPHRPPQRR